MKKGVGERLKILRDSLGMKNQTKFAEKLEITQTSLSKYENETVDIPDDVKIKMSEMGINLHWLITGNGEIFLQNTSKTGFKQIPVYSEKDLPEGAFIVPLIDQRLSAGDGAFLPEEDQVTALIHVPAYLSRYGDKIKALTVDGDSMSPTLHRGDIVVCDSAGYSGEGVYAIQEEGAGIVKRITKEEGKFYIVSDNEKYARRKAPEESDSFRIIGRVHCAIKQME